MKLLLTSLGFSRSAIGETEQKRVNASEVTQETL